MVTCEELTMTLSDGYAAYARYWPADIATGAALYLHGIQSHCGWYEQTAAAMCDAQIAVLQPDRRGSGRNYQDRGHADSADQLIDDAILCIENLRERTGVRRAHVIGVSWGGKLAAAVHVPRPDLVASLALVAPGIFPIVDVSSAQKFRIGWSMVSAPHRSYDIPLNDPELFTSDPKWCAFLRQDELQLHQATAGFYLASRRMDKIVARLPEAPAVPINVFLAGQERIIDNERTVELVRGLSWPHRHVTRYPRSRHTFEFGPDRDAYVADLIRWLRNPETYAADSPRRRHEATDSIT